LFNIGLIFRQIRKIAKKVYKIRHVCLSVSPHGATRLLLDGFSCNFTFRYFSKIFLQNSSFVKIGHE